MHLVCVPVMLHIFCLHVMVWDHRADARPGMLRSSVISRAMCARGKGIPSSPMPAGSDARRARSGARRWHAHAASAQAIWRLRRRR